MPNRLKVGQKATTQMPITVKKVDKENFTLTMRASTQDPDRHGDTVVQSGWDLGPFQKNPVILNSHRYDDATEVIAKATRTEVKGKGKKSYLEQDWVFAVNENPKAKIIFDLYAGGFLHASSVGFIPKKFKDNKDGSRDWFTIEEAELLEVSAVSVPANAMALAKSKGIDVDALENNQEDYDEETIDEDESNDEVPENNQIPPTDGQPASKDGGDSESESEESDEEDAGDSGDDEDTGDVQEEDDAAKEGESEQDTSEVKRVSYKVRAFRAIKRISVEKQKELTRASKIINSLLGENDYPDLHDETKEKIRMRKINQAIRALNKSK